MSICLRPVVERWGEAHTYSIDHEEMTELVQEIAARAEAGDVRVDAYGDKTAVAITDGRRFLDFLTAGSAAMLEAKALGKDNYDLSDEELAEVDAMASMTNAWCASLDREDGTLRFYID